MNRFELVGVVRSTTLVWLVESEVRCSLAAVMTWPVKETAAGRWKYIIFYI